MDIVRKLRLGPCTVGDAQEAADMIERLRAAIKWALGEGPGNDGLWFGDEKPEPAVPYWWRKPLRQLAGIGDLSYNKEHRTIVGNQQLTTDSK